MRVTLTLASLFLLGCAYGAESDPASGPGAGKDGPGVVSTLVGDSPGSAYMLAFPMDEAGMVAAESAPVPQVASADKEKEEEAATTTSTTSTSTTAFSTSTPQPTSSPKPTFQQPSEADRRRKLEEMRKILGLPANINQKPKPVPFEKPKSMLFPTLLKVLPRLDGSALSSLPLSLIRRSDEEGPKVLHGLIRQAASVFMRRALQDDEPETQKTSENKNKKDSLMFLLDDDKEDSKGNEKKGSKDDDDDDDDDDDFAFIPIPRPMIPLPAPFRRGLPPPPFGLPQRIPQMSVRRPMFARSFPPMGPPPQARMGPPRQPFFRPNQSPAPVQPVMLLLHPFMMPQQMMMPQQSVMQHMAVAQPTFVPHPAMMPPAPPQFHPHPFLIPQPMLVPQHPQYTMGHQFQHPHMAPHPMMVPQNPQYLMAPQVQQPQVAPAQLRHPMQMQRQPQMSAHQQVQIRVVPEFRPVPVPVEVPEESEGTPYMVVYEDAQSRFPHSRQQQPHPQQHQQPQIQLQIQPRPQISARSMPAILSSLRRMQMLRELIMARSLQMVPRDIPRVAFHPPVPPRTPQGEREAAQSIFRPIFMPMGL